ncbi:MAG: Ig-like domain-containing protein [Deltaproteobacteria bacterium]|nr:Ig-like domain-containing protein [Deltaproteobacteria bacterium]
MRNIGHARGLGFAVLAAIVALGSTSACPQGETGGLQPRVPEWERPATLGEEGPLAVTFGSPKGQTWTPTEIAVGFSKSMVPLDRAGTADTMALFRITPAMDGEYRWLGSQVLTFVPAAPLPLSSSFTVTVPAGVKALDGSELAAEYAFEFDTPRVRVARNDPYSGQRWRKPQSPVDLWFNQPVDPAELARHAAFDGFPLDGSATVHVEARARLGRERGRAEPRPGVEPPEDEGELDPRHLVVEPVSPLPRGAEVVLTIDGDLRGVQGNLPMGEPWTLSYETYGDFRFETASCYTTPYGGCSPTGGFHLEFTNPVKWGDAVAHLKITPAVELPEQPEWAEADQSATVWLGVELQPETTYTVELDAELRDIFGQTLVGPREGSFKVGSYPPVAYLDYSGTVLEADGPHTVPGRFRNVDSAKFVLREFSLDELLHWRLDTHAWPWDYNHELAGITGAVVSTIRPGTAPNVERVLPLSLDPAFRGGKRGFVAVQLVRPVVPGEYTRGIDSSVVRVSDLGLTAKISPRGMAVWVTSLRTARPVAGASVKVYRSARAPLFEGRTGADGLVFVPEEAAGAGNDYYPEPFLIYAEKGSDKNYLETESYWGLDPWSFGLPYSWQRAKEQLVGTVFADRGIYRPGDTVHLKGIVRALTDDGMTTPADTGVTLTVWDSRGEAVPFEAPEDFRLGPFGTFDIDVPLPPDAPLGYFQVNARLGPPGEEQATRGNLYGSFRVAEYKAPTFAVKVAAEKEEYLRGDTLSFRVEGQYLFGAPMAAADARWWVSRSDTAFGPKGEDWEGYWFGEEWNWWEEPDEAPTSGAVAESTGRLAADGTLAGTAALDFARMRGPASVAIEGQVTDLDRSSVAGRRTVVVHPGEFYLGVKRLEEGILEAGQDLAVAVVALSPDEQVRAGVAVHGALSRREWHTVRQEGMGGHYDYVTRPEDEEIGRCEVVTTSAPVRCAIRVPEAGDYVLRLEAVDGRGNPIRTSFETWASGAGGASWYRSDDNRMELGADKPLYRPGDTAKILVQSPFPESEALLTVERAGLLVRKSFHVSGNAPVIEVPILDTYRPNVFVSVLLVRGRVRDTPDERGDDPGKPAYAMGMVQLAVETASKRLAVEVRPERAEYGPGAEIKVDVTVRGADGAGTPAEVTLFAVDEAVLQLTGYEPPELMDVFWALRSDSVRTAEIRQAVISRRTYDEDKGAAGGGGGGGAGGALRTDFRTVAYWNPAVLTDAEGRASVTFRLPENLTTYRIMAVATTQADRFGAGKAEVKIAKPLLLRAALPRFVRTDDRFEAGVVVTNRGGPAGDAVVTVEVEGLRLDGAASRTVRLEPGRSAEVRFPFVSGAPGTARFRFRVAMGDLGDGLETTREVKLPMIPEAVATYGETLARAIEGVGDLELIRPDVGGLTVAVSSSALTGLQSAMEYLWWYPYQCTEQLVSRIVPLVALRELCDGLGLEPPPNAEKLVAEALALIPERQRPDGGFGSWSDSWRSDPWLTGYVVWGLRRAQERDVKVPESVLARAIDYLSDQLRRSDVDPGSPWLSLSTKAFIVYVLADAGVAEIGFQEALFDRYEDMPLIARGWLALAYILSDDACAAGDCVPIVELRRDLENHVFQTAEEAHFEENAGDLYRVLMQSNTTLNAILLDVLLAMDVNHPIATKIAKWLLEERDGGHWATTQDSAWALLAFAHFYRVREAEEPDFTATVDFGDERLLSQRFEGRPAKEYREEVPMSRLMEGRGDRLAIERQGPSGRLYYALSLHYVRSDLPEEGIDRGFYLERHYEVVDLAAMREGAGIERAEPSITRVRAGDLVRVQVTIAVPQERTMVVVEDPLPAGLESVDFDLRTTSLSLLRASSGYEVGDNDPYGGYSLDSGPPDDGYYGYGYGYGYGYDDYSDEWWWTPFYHREDRDDRVLLFADVLPAGVHHYEYLAQAVTPGTFVVGPLRAEEMYNPETFGRTGVLEFVVDAPAE